MRNLKVIFALFAIAFFALTSCQKDTIENLETAELNQSATTESGAPIVSLTTEDGQMLNRKIQLEEAQSSQDAFTLKMDNGNELQFFPMEDQQTKDYMVLESGICESCSALGTLKDIGKKEYTARDIYWAFSKPGTQVPFPLTSQKSLLAESHIGTQGWALKKMEAATATSNSRSGVIACNNTSFRSTIAGGFLDGTTSVRYDKTPLNYSYFVKECLDPFNDGRCWPGDQRYSYGLKTSNVRKWAGKVCVKAVETSYNDHDIYWCGGSCPSDPNCDNPNTNCTAYFGPEITFEYYYKGEWRTMKNGSETAKFVAPKNQTKWWSWYWRSSDPQSYRLKVRNALAYDQFDFMCDKEF